MDTTTLVHDGVNLIIEIASNRLIPLMVVIFSIGILFRMVLYFTIKREEWFINEFEKRVEQTLDKQDFSSFYHMVKKNLEKTFYEAFELRAAMRRRKPDIIMSVSDRIFMIQQGSARFVRDILNPIEHQSTEKELDYLDITKNSFERNSSFSKAFGLISNTLINNILSVLPGIFIVLGIFGTFIGIMAALPGLTGIDFSNAQIAQKAMDQFLVKITFSMSTSIVGIILSVSMNILNTVFSVEEIYIKTVDKCVHNLKLLWNVSLAKASSAEKSDIEDIYERSINKEIGLVFDFDDKNDKKAA